MAEAHKQVIPMQMQHQQSGDWLTANTRLVKRDLYANHIDIDRREHDAVIQFSLRSENEGTVVTKVTVPLGALEGLS